MRTAYIQVVADDISEKEVVAEATATEIGEATRSYTPAGAYNAVLFFCVADMGAIDPMYQYSLPWFLALFVRSIRDSRPTPPSGDGDETPTPKRLDQIANHFTLSLYGNVCHSLFEKDKLLFSFLLTTRLMASRGALPRAEYDFLLTGGTGPPALPRPPGEDWISGKMWGELCGLGALGDADPDGSAPLAGLPSAVSSSAAEWKAIFDSSEPHEVPLPGELNRHATPFQRLCILRCLRPDRVVMGIQVDPPISMTCTAIYLARTSLFEAENCRT
jgi:dynein heavy chain